MHIDFGNGHTLDRTLNGNIAFWFVTAEGEAFDLLPGLVDVPTFLARCSDAAVMARRLSATSEPDLRRRIVVEAHARRIVSPLRFDPASEADISKRRVERPIKDSLDSGVDIAANHAVALTNLVVRPDISKLAVELPLKRSLDVRTAIVLPVASGLPADTAFNQRVRFPMAERLMVESPLARPAALTERVYLEILGVDLADPYLGLAPYLLGGEPGRDGEGTSAH